MTIIRKLAEKYTEADVDDEVIVMRLDTGELLSLAGTAAATWRLIDGHRDRDALAEALASEYAGDRSQIADDIAELLRTLEEAGLVAEQ